MSYTVDGVDKTAGIREKAKSICELVSEPSRLEEEREFAKKNRDKFRSGQGNNAIGNNENNSYKGFGSEDLKKYGGPESYTPGSNYDPYKKDSIFGERKKSKEEKKPRRRKRGKKERKQSSSSDEDSDEESSGEDSDSSVEEHKVTKYKKKSKGISKPKKKGERVAPIVEAPAPAAEPSLVEMFETPSAPAPAAT